MVQTIAQMYRKNTALYPSLAVQMEKNKKGQFIEKSYKELENDIFALALAFQTLNVKRQQLIGLISDNCGNWLLSDLAIQYLGAVDVPRGLDATDIELTQILSQVECEICLVQNETMLKRIIGLRSELPKLKTLIVFNPKFNVETDLEVISFDSFLELGRNILKENPKSKEIIIKEVEKGTKDELCTIIFTSGTTGNCKGVMLTQDNFIFEIDRVATFVDGKFEPGQRWLSVLPIWHSLERAVTYSILFNSQCVCYSKPIGKVMLMDFKKTNPHWFCSVPRIWHTIHRGIENKIEKEKGLKKVLGKTFIKSAIRWKRGYNKIKGNLPRYKNSSPRILEFASGLVDYSLNYPLYKMGEAMMFNKIRSTLGTNFIAGISGGGSMPKAVDRFFNAIGINLLDGYGMTETAPILSVRDLAHPILGTMNICPDTEFKIVDENGFLVADGDKGILKVRGRQIMKGYYKNPQATKQILDKDGWLNTGDLVVQSLQGGFSVVGRAKDTIVLLGGENLEPLPIEGKLSEVDFIESVVVIGQDRKFLSALIVPNTAAIKEHFSQLNENFHLEKEAMYKIIQEKINEKINSKFGFKSYELINKFTILEKSFEIGKELSAKQELKRFEIEKKYLKEINAMYAF